MPPVTKFFREILADQQSSSRTLENQRAQFTLQYQRRFTAQLPGYFSYKGLGGKFGGLGFLQIFILK
jgi:hypothetical protein